MSLVVTRVAFDGYRNLSGRVLEPAAGVTVLVGPNAVGKTNTVEALQYLTAGTSFRRPTPAELVAAGASSETARPAGRETLRGRSCRCCSARMTSRS